MAIRTVFLNNGKAALFLLLKLLFTIHYYYTSIYQRANSILDYRIELTSQLTNFTSFMDVDSLLDKSSPSDESIKGNLIEEKGETMSYHQFSKADKSMAKNFHFVRKIIKDESSIDL